MGNNGKWLNWAALIVGGLALVFALTSRGGSSVNVQVPGGPAGVTAQGNADQNANGPRGFNPGRNNQQAMPNDPRSAGPGSDFQAGPGNNAQAGPGGNFQSDRGNDFRGGPGPMGHRGFGFFGLIGGVLKFLGFLLIIGLVMRFFFGRRGWNGPWNKGAASQPAQSAPSTSAPATTVETERSDDDSDPPSTGETVRL